MNIKTIPLSELKPYPNNPRKNDEAVDAVAASIGEFGFKGTLVVDKDYTIIAGHTRYKAAQKLGITELPCIVADDLTDEQVKAFRLADNKTAELAGWDYEKLEQELADLDLDMSDFGFTEVDISSMDDLFAPAEEKEPEEPKEIQCPHCKMWFTP